MLTSMWFLIFAAVSIGQAIADCEINPVESTLSPLLISSNGENIVYPEIGQKTVKFKAGQSVNFGCPTGQVLLRGRSRKPFEEATCVSATQFKISGTTETWRDIKCSDLPTAIGKFSGKTCVGGKEGVIGFSFGTGKFIPQITFCFDAVNENTLYTNYEIIPQIELAYRNTPRPFFEQDPGFYNIGSETVNNLYLRNTQRKTINKLLGLPENSLKYIQNGQEYFLARGHMAARVDFFYPTQMNATFKYTNAAPQWQSFNGGNWESAEVSSREYATRNKVTLKVWTGTYGEATLPHSETGKDTELYIYVNNNQKAIRVPALYWKLVFEPKAKKGVVILGVNNPYEKDVKKHVICPDISSKISWMKWQKENITQGYSYACSIEDFRKVVSYAPEVTASGLLV